MHTPPPKGPRYRKTPLWRDSNRFLVEVETAVRTFPRYHKYTLGSDATALSTAASPAISPVFESNRGD